MKLVIDTNTLISGALWDGAPARLLDAIKTKQVTLLLSPALWAEFADVVGRGKLAQRIRQRGFTPTLLAESLHRYVVWATPADIRLPPALRDPKDLPVLAAAVGGAVDAIVTGDDDLLALRSFEGIPVLRVEQALEQLGLR